jgi:hypothetical protein
MSSYKVVYVNDTGSHHETLSTLESQVNGWLKEGWICIGGLLIGSDKHGYPIMYQTMVKPPV